MKEGQGTFQWSDGTIFTGQGLNGKQHGTGVITTDVDAEPSIGIWERGKRIRVLTREDIEQLEQQQQELVYDEEVAE